MRRIVVIGFQSAGLTAAATARMADREAKITVIERRMYATYHPCGLPFAIGGDVPHIRHLVEAAPNLPGVEVHIGTEAKAIDTGAKTVEIQDRRTLRKGKIPYDSLVLATGSLPLKPPVPGVDLGNVFTLRTMRDGEEILAALPRVSRAVVVGAGAVGIEAASALRERGLETTLVEMQPSVLPGMLDPDMSDAVIDRLNQVGISTVCGKPVKEIRGGEKVSSVVLEDKEIPADIVILAVGVKPDVELAREAGIEFGPTEMIKVDDHLRTSAPDVYAAGDCAETRCFFTNRPIKSQLATTAIRMGKVAGVNAAGGDEVFRGVLNTVVSSAYGLEIASTGLTTQAAKEAGIETIAGRIRTLSKPYFYPGAEPIIVKLVVEPKERRIVGGQVIGDGAAERVNMLAFAITHNVTVDELARIEYCYAPPVNDCIEPLVVAAEAVLRRL
ncbi:MAG: FAD-dependent oxidoreductase [Candidatus Hodarchaeaceae archaeon]|nr:FAD-dependent oxidoreductase [Candidatus Hodarchaeaceae archaeon]